ncbi:unnamed protein product [Rotaria magnacalcarata]|uniref:SH3 and PX domain-containing protein 2A n=1 Tax=Rotaria magnacalcarata TaxID=392030 RepID=A0A816GBC3_9BILA|nr:unnamed protein product [Rotaria magnacalcarata]
MNNKKSSNNTAYIKSVKIVNVEKRYQPGGKHYVYVIEVNWSNSENLFTIYRRYNQFFDLQCRILNLLAATGLRSNHRIPYLPGKIILGRSQIHQIATERKTTLDEYCQKLFSLPERITRSRPILEFFRPSKTDEEKPIQLNVDESKLIRKSSIDISNLTKSVTFRCIQDFNADDKNEMSLKQNDIVEVLDNTDNGWWLVNKGNQKGYVPATFLETTELNHATKYIINKTCEADPDESRLTRSSSIDISNLTKLVTFRCIQDFNADDKNEMSLKQNDIVEVLDNTDNGWWLVNKGNQKGYVPATFLETTELNHATKYIINKTCEADPDESRLTRSSSIDISNLTKLVTFRCIQDFNADDKNEMSLKQNDIVEVLDNTDNGWWLVNKGNQKGYVPATFLVPTELHQDNHQEESFNKSISSWWLVNKGNQKGYVPATFLVPTELHQDNHQEESFNKSIITKYVVNESYDAIMTDEISLLKDSCVIVIEKSLLGWWRVEFNNNTGLFPSAYLTPWEMLHTSENSTTNTSAVNAKIKELDDSDDSDWDDDDDDYEYSKEPNNDAKFELYYAHSDYSGNTEDFLSFRRGDCIEIRDKTCGGWWYGRRVNSEQILTWIPGNHLQKEPILNETSDDRNDPPSIHSECDSNISDIPLDVSANKQEEKILADIEDQSLESPLLTEVVYAEVIQTPQIVEPEKVHNKSPVSIPAFQKNNNDKDTKPKAVKELVKLYNQLIV